MKKKENQFRYAVTIVALFLKHISGYNQVLMSTMLLRMVRHPKETGDLKALILNAQETMRERYSSKEQKGEEENLRRIAMKFFLKFRKKKVYGKSDVMDVTWHRNLDNLEEDLEHIDQLPEGVGYDEGYLSLSYLNFLFKKMTLLRELIEQIEIPEASIETDESLILNEEEFTDEFLQILENQINGLKVNFPKHRKLENTLKQSKMPDEWQIDADSVMNSVLKHIQNELM